MKEPMTPLERKLRQAGVLIAAGLLVEALTLWSASSLAFLAFVGIGVLLVAVGILRYLLVIAGAGLEPPASGPGSG